MKKNTTPGVLIAAFLGWNDASQAASDVIRELIYIYGAKRVCTIDGDMYYNLQENRPVLCQSDDETEIVWPTTDIFRLDLEDRDNVYLLIGPEPDFQWRLYCSDIMSAAEKFNISHIVTLCSYFTPCTHTRPLIVNHGFGLQGSEGDPPTGYSGPIGIVTALDFKAAEQGYDHTSLWVPTPDYVQNEDSCPPGTVALINELMNVVGINVDLTLLSGEADAWNEQVSAMVDNNPQLAQRVHKIENDYDRKQQVERAINESKGQAENLATEAEKFLKSFDD